MENLFFWVPFIGVFCIFPIVILLFMCKELGNIRSRSKAFEMNNAIAHIAKIKDDELREQALKTTFEHFSNK